LKNRAFLINAAAVTITAFLLRASGIYFNAYLSRRIGAEGVGLYNLIYSVYIMASALVTSGISLAVSRIVAEQMEKHNPQKIRPTMVKCTVLSVVFSLLISALLFFGADFIASYLLGVQRTALPLRIMAPSYSFMAVSSCFRGYFIAARKAHKSALSSLFEQLFRIALTVLLLQFMLPKELESCCSMVVLGSTCAEIIGCFFTYLIFRYERRDEQASRSLLSAANHTQGASLRMIFGISIPMTLNAGLRTGLRTAESMLIPAGLRKSGVSHESSLAEFGVLSGMAMPVLFFPTFMLMSVAMLILPEVARADAIRQKRRVQYMGARIMQLTLYMSVMIAGILLVFPEELCLALFRNNEAGGILRLLAPLVPLIYLDFMVDGMLNGLNQHMMTLKLNTADSAMRIGLILVLVPLLGISGYMITLYISTVFNSSLSLKRLLKVSNLRIPIYHWIIKPVMLSLLSALASSIVFRLALSGAARAGALAVPEIVLACLLHLCLLRMTGALKHEDVLWLKSFFTSKKLPA